MFNHNFISLVKYIIKEAVEGVDKTYKLLFKYSSGSGKGIQVDIYREFPEDEFKQIYNANKNAIWEYPKNKADFDQDLYVVHYTQKNKDKRIDSAENHVNILMLNARDFENIEDRIKPVEDVINIRQASSEDLSKIVKRESISGVKPTVISKENLEKVILYFRGEKKNKGDKEKNKVDKVATVNTTRRVDFSKINKEPTNQYYLIDKKGGLTNVVNLTDKQVEKYKSDPKYKDYDIEKIEKGDIKALSKKAKPASKERVVTSKNAIEFVFNNDNTIGIIIRKYQSIKDDIKKIKDIKKDASQEDIINSLDGAKKISLETIDSKISELVDNIKKEDFKTQEDILKILKDKFKNASSLSIYNKIEGDITSQEIKESMKKKVKEMSTTGTGAFATPGEGEGIATKYAFAGAGADPKKKKKLKEEAQTKDDLGKATMIYDLIKNTVMNMTVKKALANLPKVKEFYINLEKAAGDIATLADKYEKSDSDKSNQLSEISSNIIKLDNVLSSLITIYEKAQSNPIK